MAGLPCATPLLPPRIADIVIPALLPESPPLLGKEVELSQVFDGFRRVQARDGQTERMPVLRL